MILGLGTDLAYIPRFLTILSTKPSRHVTRLSQRILHPVYEMPEFERLYFNVVGQKEQNSQNSHDSHSTQNTLDSQSTQNTKVIEKKEYRKGNLNCSSEIEPIKNKLLLDAANYLASRWAIKEALYKSLDPLAQSQCRFNEWYKINLLDESVEEALRREYSSQSSGKSGDKKDASINGDDGGVSGKDDKGEGCVFVNTSRFKRPYILNPQYSTQHPSQVFHLSISHDHDYVTATVIRESIENKR